MDFLSTLSLSPPRAHLVLTGELDAFSGITLRNRLDEAVGAGSLLFTVDASAVSFVDAGGLGTLVRLRNVVRPLGGTVEVSAASEVFRWIADVAGLGTAFELDPVSVEPSAP